MANPTTDDGEQQEVGVEPMSVPHAYRLPPTAYCVNPRSKRAFTLIELLTVIAIIGILASITITAGRGIHERSQIARAKADMAVLAAALEQYKQHYGDYPWTPDPGPSGLDGGAILFNALNGNLGPKAAAALTVKGRTFVELAKFNLESTTSANLPEPDDPELKVNWFNDPWGNWYYYAYKKTDTDANWKRAGFLLYSHGPDGFCNIGGAADSGLLDVPGGLPTDADWVAKNADNIYYGGRN